MPCLPVHLFHTTDFAPPVRTEFTQSCSVCWVNRTVRWWWGGTPSGSRSWLGLPASGTSAERGLTSTHTDACEHTHTHAHTGSKVVLLWEGHDMRVKVTEYNGHWQRVCMMFFLWSFKLHSYLVNYQILQGFSWQAKEHFTIDNISFNL